MKKMILIAVVVFGAVVAPIQAKPPHPPKPTAPPAHANKCQPHAVAYVVSGTLDSGSLTLNSDGTYTGTLTVFVKQAEKHAKADKGTHKTYTLTSAKVKLHGENPAALTANSRVHLEGTVTTIAKRCDQTGAGTITITRADLKVPRPPKH